MGKGDHLCRNKREGSKLLQATPELWEKFRWARQEEFYFWFEGFHDCMDLTFAVGFDGQIARITKLTFLVSEEIVTEATSVKKNFDKG